MSMKAVLWALYDVPQEKVRGAALRTLLVLADHADTKGKGAYPSQKRLCALTGYSRRTIQETLKDLEAEGLIRRGDQRLVGHIAANYRPIVWDLNMDDAPNDRGAKTAPLENRTTEAQHTAPLGAQSGAQKNDGRGAIRGAVCLRTEPNKEEPFIEPRESNARARKIGDWKPTPEHRALAARLGLDCEAEAAKFTDLALDQDAESADWDARFRNWLRRGHELGITRTTGNTGSTHRHTWKCAHTLQLLQRDETDALCDALACTVATALNEGADPQTITSAVRDGDIGRLRDLTWEPA